MAQIGHKIGAHKSTNLLPNLAAFLAVVEAGSFTKAAQRAGVDKTLLSRRVKALEAALEVRLLNRTTRSLHVTEAGRTLAEAAAEPLQESIHALQLAAAPDSIQGTVRVASIPETSAEIWGPVLVELARTHPELHIDMSASEVMVRLIEGGFDLAIRVGRMPDSSLVCRKLASWRYLLCASPEWVAAHPEVQSPAELAPHWVLYGDVPNANRWRFERGDEAVDVEMDSVFTTDNGMMQCSVMLAGMGVSALTPFSVMDALRSGALVRVLPEWRVSHVLGIYGVTPHRAYLPARVEVVLDAVKRRIKSQEAVWREYTG